MILNAHFFIEQLLLLFVRYTINSPLIHDVTSHGDNYENAIIIGENT